MAGRGAGHQFDFFEKQRLLSDAATLVYMSGRKKEDDFQRFMIQTNGLSAITGGDGSELDVRRFIGGSYFDEGVEAYSGKFEEFVRDALDDSKKPATVDINKLMTLMREYTCCDALMSAVVKTVVDSGYQVDETVNKVRHLIRNSVSLSGELQRMLSAYHCKRKWS